MMYASYLVMRPTVCICYVTIRYLVFNMCSALNMVTVPTLTLACLGILCVKHPKVTVCRQHRQWTVPSTREESWQLLHDSLRHSSA